MILGSQRPISTEAMMAIHMDSKTGPLVPPTADVTAALSRQIDAVKQRWLDQLARDPASFGRLEVEIHDEFRRLADQMTASLLAEAMSTNSQVEPGKKGGLAGSTPHDDPLRREG
jgi:hypothetical protein